MTTSSAISLKLWKEAEKEMYASFGSEDFKEGVAHYFEKRAPRFTGR